MLGHSGSHVACLPVERGSPEGPPACTLARSWGGGRDVALAAMAAVGIRLGSADEGSPARGPTGVARRPHSGRAEMVGTHAHQGSGREKAEGCASKFDAGYYRRLLGKALAEVEFVLGLQCYGK